MGRMTQAEPLECVRSPRHRHLRADRARAVRTRRHAAGRGQCRSSPKSRDRCSHSSRPRSAKRQPSAASIATGLSGPARPYAGAARDFVLGTRVLNGKAEVLRFGGEVMKNVAGYDVSRLMTGAYGTLGVLLEVSLKVLPRPVEVRTVAFETSAEEAIERCNAWAAKPIPITGACHDGERLHVRLAGTAGGRRGGEPMRSAARRSTATHSGRRSASRRCRSSPGPAHRCGGCRFRPAPRC